MRWFGLFVLPLAGCSLVVGTAQRTVASDDGGADVSEEPTRDAVTCDPNACQQQRDACRASCQAAEMTCTQHCGNDEMPSKQCETQCTQAAQQCTSACDAPCTSC